MIFFYEFVFVLMALAAVIMGELWSRLAASVFLGVCLVIVTLGYASFGARLAMSPEAGGIGEGDRRWFTDARDGLRHLRLLLGVATLAAIAWKLLAG